jgi:hypothetical protein
MAVYTTIDDPSAFFQTATYTGGGGGSSVVNDGNSDLQPDLVWFATREGNNKPFQDSTRGGTKNLYSDLSQGADTTPSGVGITSFDSDGFTFGSTAQTYFNLTSKTYVAWQWKAGGGTTASNSNGSITSTVQSNTTAGFSIVTYTGTGSAGTVGHGLGVVPAMIWVKCRNEASTNWTVYHKNSNATPQNFILELNNTNAVADNDRFNDTAPTSSVFSVNAGSSTVNKSSNTYLAYVFAEKQGYSRFSKYVGNGNANGAFIYTGFKPAFIMTKRTDTAGYHWRIYDAKRNPFNIVNARLSANNSDAEYTGTSGNEHCDFLSNGWKWKTNASDQNVDGGTYIYMAFAENPFVTSTGIPTTAR